MLFDLILRFVLGGIIVCLFAVTGDTFKPRSFAGLFGAAPSVAIATLALTFHRDGRPYATVEARSMILGAIALGVYAWLVCQWLARGRSRTLTVTCALLPVWFASAFALYFVLFH